MSDKVYAMDEHTFYVTNHDDKTVAFNGGDDDYISVAFENVSVTGEESAKGAVQWNRRVTRKGTITVSLQWGSNENDILNQMFFDQSEGNLLKSSSVKRITQTENTTLYSTVGRLFIQKIPDDSLGAEGGSRIWIFDVEKMTADERTAVPG